MDGGSKLVDDWARSIILLLLFGRLEVRRKRGGEKGGRYLPTKEQPKYCFYVRLESVKYQY